MKVSQYTQIEGYVSAGLFALDEQCDRSFVADLDRLSAVLVRQKSVRWVRARSELALAP